MSKYPLYRKIPYGHLAIGVAGWIALLFVQHQAMIALATTLTILAIPRFIRGPRTLAEKRVIQRLLQKQQNPAKRLQKHMLPNEEFLLELREHPIVLIWWWLASLAWTAATGFIVAHPNWEPLPIHWTNGWIIVFWITGMVPLIARLIIWQADKIAVTNLRVFAVEGVIRLRVSMIPLKSITDKDLVAPWHAVILAWLRLIETEYGVQRLETAGENTKLARMIYVPNVFEVSKLVMSYALPDAKAAA